MNDGLRILYVASWVLGDPGANAADIFPRLCAAHADVDKVIVADRPRNKFHIETRQHAEYLRLEWKHSLIRYAARIARKAKQEDIDVIHVFYRQQNAILLIFIRIFLFLVRGHSKIVMDHRSVNLAKGWRRARKQCLNLTMQFFCHHLAGNPWAVETNHPWIFRKKHVIDLGYDTLPPAPKDAIESKNSHVNVWFVGSLKPKNRKSDFLLNVFDRVSALRQETASEQNRDIRIHVAGPTSESQKTRLNANPHVTYHGQLPRAKLYQALSEHPGIGLAYMNHEFHEYAPSLKFCEYAMARFKILASNTLGLQTQAKRLGLHDVRHIPEEDVLWAEAVLQAAGAYQGLEPPWNDAARWSYSAIFERQVLGLYRESIQPNHTRSNHKHMYQNKKSVF